MACRSFPLGVSPVTWILRGRASPLVEIKNTVQRLYDKRTHRLTRPGLPPVRARLILEFHRRAHLPIVMASGLLNRPVKVSWWNGLPLRLTV